MTIALLSIGTSTTRIDLLNREGFLLNEWIPEALDHIGTWRDSPLADGRTQIDYRNTNVVDTFDIKLRQPDRDATIQQTQELRRILRTGIDYWKHGSFGDLVYLEARAACETNTRYAIVRDGRMPTDDSPYRAPFLSRSSVMDNLRLIVEHGPWSDQIPGESACVQVSGIQSYANVSQQTSITDTPAANSDDGEYFGTGGWSLTGGNTTIGNSAGTLYSTIVRFTTVAVPQGATILSAFVRFESDSNQAGTTVKIFIDGEDADDAATFSSRSNFFARPRTSASKFWEIRAAWTTGNTYDSVDISPIIQEIVDRSGWVSGNDLSLQFKESKSDTNAFRQPRAFDHATGTPPTLYITYATAEADYGRAATCDNEVYFANKHNRAQLTHVWRYDAAPVTWTNLLTLSLPYNLFPAGGVANGDITYFGIDTSLVDSGPFCSLVFDIGAVATYTGNASIDWEYWNGAWVALTVHDNTDAGDGPFGEQGVNSVHWTQPADWTTTAVNGITGYWVRAEATVAAPPGDSITTPTQRNRHPYTIVWPYVEAQAAQIAGDIPALARHYIYGQASVLDAYFPQETRSCLRVVSGLRSYDRGADFTAYINISDEQNPTGITITPGAYASFSDDPETVTGRVLTHAIASANAEELAATIEIDSTLSTQWYGTFHGYVRTDPGSGDTYKVRLKWVSGFGSVERESEKVTITNANQDASSVGRVDIPPIDTLTGDEITDFLQLLIYVECDNAAGSIEVLDLVLMPADEWIGEFSLNPAIDASTKSYLGTNRILDIDSIANPKQNIRSHLVVEDTSQITVNYLNRGFPAIWQANERQRLWFFTMSSVTTGNFNYSEFENANSYQGFKAQRYMSMRGDR